MTNLSETEERRRRPPVRWQLMYYARYSLKESDSGGKQLDFITFD